MINNIIIGRTGPTEAHESYRLIVNKSDLNSFLLLLPAANIIYAKQDQADQDTTHCTLGFACSIELDLIHPCLQNSKISSQGFQTGSGTHSRRLAMMFCIMRSGNLRLPS